MRKEILEMMSEEERNILFQSFSAAVTLQGVLCEYDVNLAYNIIEGGNLDEDEEGSYEEELKVVNNKIQQLQPAVEAFTKILMEGKLK